MRLLRSNVNQTAGKNTLQILCRCTLCTQWSCHCSCLS